MVVCYLEDDPKKKDALVVRTFCQLDENLGLTMSRDVEVMGLQVAHAIGFGHSVYAIYQNGVVYGYAPGRTLNGEDVKDPKFIRYIILVFPFNL